MRLRVNLQLERQTALPINHQHYLTGVVYRFLEQADADYAGFLHEQGYEEQSEDEPGEARVEGDAPGETRRPHRRRFKLFVFAPLRSTQRRILDDTLYLGPGAAHWLVSSPVEPFLMNFASGLLAHHGLPVGRATVPIAGVETLPGPDFGESAHFICLSPVVVAVTAPPDAPDARFYREGAGGSPGRKPPATYLRPDNPRFSEGVRRNLLGKYSALYGRRPADDRLTLTFDRDYLSSHKGTKVITYKDDIRILGAFCPFTLTGSPELITFAYECGLGEKNSIGFGMIEHAKKNNASHERSI